MPSFWRRLTPNNLLLAGATIFAAIITTSNFRPKSGEQVHQNPSPPKDVKPVSQSQGSGARPLPTDSPRKLKQETIPSNPSPAPQNAKVGRPAHAKPDNGPILAVNPSEAAETKKIIHAKQDLWLANHPGIVTRYHAGKADKAEIEQSIRELEIIEGLASDIADLIDEHWADSRITELQLIDTGPIRGVNRY